MTGETTAEGHRPPDDAESNTRRWVVAGWLCCLVWWVGAYVLTLDLEGWIFTELATLKAGRLSFAGMLADRATFGHCPLYFSLSWAIQRIFGESLIALRLPSAVFGLLAAVLAHRITRRWAGEAAAAVTCLVVLLGPFLIEISKQARPYSLALVFGLAATAVMLDPRQLPGHTRAVVFGLASLAGLLTSHAYWLVLGAHGAVLLVGYRRHLAMLVAGALAVAGAMPWTIYAARFATSGGERGRFLTWMSPVEAGASLALPGRLVVDLGFRQGGDMTLPIAASVVAVAIAAFGLFALPRIRPTAGSAALGATLATLWIGPPLAALVAGLAGWGNLLLVPRYFAVTAVVQLVLISWAAWSVRPGMRAAAVALLAAVLTLGSIGALHDASRDEIRSGARIVAAEGRRNEAVIVIATLGDVRLFKHYVDTPVIACFVERGDDDPAAADRHFPAYRGRRRGVWIMVPSGDRSVVATTRTGRFEVGAYLDELGRRYRRRTSHPLGDYELHHFAERIPGSSVAGGAGELRDPINPIAH